MTATEDTHNELCETKDSTAVSEDELVEQLQAAEQQRLHLTQNAAVLNVNVVIWAWSIYDIDNRAQTFSATFEVLIERELSSEEHAEFVRDPADFTPNELNFYPRAAQEVKQMERYVYHRGKPYFIVYNADLQRAFVQTMTFCNVTFCENLELESFPFDVQHYEIGIRVDGRDMNMSVCEKAHYKFKINKVQFAMDPSGSNLIGCNFDENPHLQMSTRFSRRFQDTVFEVRACFAVKREWRFYVLRVIAILAIISFLTNLCFFFGDIETSIPDRFGFISTSLLTAVAYMFITAEYIPPLKYLTLLDLYIYFTFAYIFMIGIENACIFRVESLNTIDDIDFTSFVINLCVWLAMHVVYFFKARAAWKTELKKYGMFKHQVDEGQRYLPWSVSSDPKDHDLHSQDGRCFMKNYDSEST